MNKPLSEIRAEVDAKIREANPKLMELSFGSDCVASEVSENEENMYRFRNRVKSIKGKFIARSCSIGFIFANNQIYRTKEHGRVHSLGYPISLQNVLVWLTELYGESYGSYSCDADFLIGEEKPEWYTGAGFYVWGKYEAGRAKFDLSENYSSQPEEFYRALHKLI